MVGVPWEATVLTLIDAPGWLTFEGFLLCMHLFHLPFMFHFYLTQFTYIDDYIFLFFNLGFTFKFVADFICHYK